MKDCSPKLCPCQGGGSHWSLLGNIKTMGSNKNARTPAQGHLKRQRGGEAGKLFVMTPCSCLGTGHSLPELEKLELKTTAVTPQELAGLFI